MKQNFGMIYIRYFTIHNPEKNIYLGYLEAAQSITEKKKTLAEHRLSNEEHWPTKLKLG